ncbi:leucine-rich repeat and IQ domain-containing protein 3 isoform X2 [Rousettus aegyptiacus]|uniref:leucine-rich repeat and IQ domain-containing protein 3 isoform X2 n=1 Tax=Rousettus aegyptiacus TaxID=9407 RepID=UPI00168CC11A|nr:leucine-rich repeat and IQ domain-containing protein 3 isoform X2 [Rousettus aegyptiacus]
MFHGTVTKELTSHEEWSHYNENIIEDQKDFVFMKFSGLHLKSMENLRSCISLRVCIFSNNFITDISPLQSCIKLVKLDLHGNQVKSLPDTKFWSGLKKLQLLYLHDNGFAKLRNICMLSACPSLIALTMFDCPVSLKKGYRHVLVNSIWTLKALDHHVISDEEIIQNWHLPERFKTYNHRLFFNFCPALKKNLHSPVDLENSSEQRKYISSILYKLKNIGKKSKKSRHLIQKDQKSEDEIEDELDASFRISVFKLPIHPSDSLKYATVLKEKGQDSFSTYAQPFSTTHQKKVIKRKDKLLEKNVRKFLITQKTGIKLQTLYDIDKYYSKQKKQESHEKKVMAVTMAKDAEESVSLTVRESSSKKKYAAQRRKAKDDLTIQCGLQKLWQDKFNYLEKVRERRALFLEEKKQKAEERLLIQNLNNERAILAKGMINMDRLNKKEAVLREKSLIVQQKLEREKYLKELRKYMKDLRAQEIYKRHCEEKFVLDMITFQKACERIQDAKTKVALVKTNLVLKVPSGMRE